MENGQVTPGKSDPNNHRSTSVIPVVSKVFEKIVYDQLYEYLNDNKLLHREPSHPFGTCIKYQISVSPVFCVLLPPFCCKLRGLLVRGLEPRLRKSGTRKFLGGSDH